MLRLDKGNYTGKVSRRVGSEYTFISIVHYHPGSAMVGMHYHENPHLCFLLQGEDKEKRNGETSVRMCGDIFFYPAGQVHATIAQERVTKNLVIEFEETFMRKSGLTELQIESLFHRNPYLKFQLLRLLREVALADDSHTLAVDDALINLISESQDKPEASAPGWSKTVNEILHDNWSRNVSLDEISNLVQKHPVTISKYFAKYNRCTIGEYVRRIRVEKSIPMIKNTAMSLSEIAYNCGFADQSHFIRVFKETTGFLPAELRKL